MLPIGTVRASNRKVSISAIPGLTLMDSWKPGNGMKKKNSVKLGILLPAASVGGVKKIVSSDVGKYVLRAT